MTALDDTGAVVPWQVRQSTEIRADLRVLDGGTPRNLTSTTIVAGIKASEALLATGPNLATFTVTVADQNSTATRGRFTLLIPNLTLAPGHYHWYCQFSDPNDHAYLHGPFVVKAWIN